MKTRMPRRIGSVITTNINDRNDQALGLIGNEPNHAWIGIPSSIRASSASKMGLDLLRKRDEILSFGLHKPPAFAPKLTFK
jgi:hypothetical protein